ncbi:MAG: cadmium-translocating P-type ATPase [Syntrophomonadaceae bacterium]|nr:cadmium-translocating P-type ATPase [Syntrophomonadaceae bacterium]
MGEALGKAEGEAGCAFQINGLDCADCAAKVEKAIKLMPGVASATVAFPIGKLLVELDLAQVRSEEVIEKIKALGYEARQEEKSGFRRTTTTLRINGLDCPDCAAKLEKGISAIPGVEQTQVNFGAAKAVVTHRGPVSEIMATVEKLGYSGDIQSSGGQKKKASIWNTNQYALPTVVSLVFMLSGLIAGKMSFPDLVPIALFLTGIVSGGFLPAKKGIAVLINTRELDMNILMSIAVIGAVVISQYEEAAAVVFLFSLGNALQSYTLDKTRNSISALMELTPAEALVSRNGLEVTLPIEEIRIGEMIIVRPGERIAMDGQVIKGLSSVNQAPITGESLPVEKKIGDEVYAGAINGQGSLEIRASRLAQDNTLSKIIDMVEEAQGQRAPSQQFVDRFARHYTPAVIVGAALVAIVPSLVFGQPLHKWFYEAMALLLVACPCALVISTPVSIVSAIGSAARNGVLIKGGVYLEEAGALSVIAFDKTGTLTVGKPQVTDVIAANGYSQPEIVAIAAAIESRSEHPLGRSIINYSGKLGLEVPEIEEFEAVLGKGARARIEGKPYYIGNAQLFSDREQGLANWEDKITGLQKEGKTVMLLGDSIDILGLIAVADVLRDTAVQTLADLKGVGITKTIMLTGDNYNTAEAIALQAGINDFKADLLPEDKVRAMKDLIAGHGKVAMIGDGVNDAPAMAVSTVGIAMGTAGTDAALETADIALMADDLSKLPYAIKLSRKTLQIIKQNISFALIIKGMILLLVIPGWLTMWLAVVGDMGTTLLVTLNGMRLLRVRH